MGESLAKSLLTLDHKYTKDALTNQPDHEEKFGRQRRRRSQQNIPSSVVIEGRLTKLVISVP